MVCQAFMNAVVMKYNKIICEKGKFAGSMITVQEDIVAKVAKQSKRKSKDHYFGDKKKSRFSPQVPSFITHFQDSAGVKDKLEDSKELNSRTFYFCDCPDHRNFLKWHMHTHENVARVSNGWKDKVLVAILPVTQRLIL